MTKSAKYLLKLERDHQLKILNKSKVCKGEWTRVEGEKRSILDYVLMKKEDEEALLSMLIDEDKVFAPGGINEEKEAVYSDHNTVICEFDWLFEQEKRDVKQKVITTKGYQKISQEIQENNIKDRRSAWNRRRTHGLGKLCSYNIRDNAFQKLME